MDEITESHPSLLNPEADAERFPQKALVYWSGRVIQVRTTTGRVLAEAKLCRDSEYVRAFNPVGREYRRKEFDREQLEALITLFGAAEMAAHA